MGSSVQLNFLEIFLSQQHEFYVSILQLFHMFLLRTEAKTVLFSALAQFFSTDTITHEPLHLT